jgi:hypothetical protein
MNVARYYGQWLTTAFAPAWVIATGTIASLTAILAGFLGKQFPNWQGTLADITWEVPVAALAMLFAGRLALSPYRMHQSIEMPLRMQLEAVVREAAVAKHEAHEALRRLEDQRNYQRIADALTERHEYGVHELAGNAPDGGEERNEEFFDRFRIWMRGVDAWNCEVHDLMVELGCTPQERSRFWTIDELKPGMFIRGDQWEAAVRLHETRIQRLWQIIESYAAKAQQVRGTNGAQVVTGC